MSTETVKPVKFQSYFKINGRPIIPPLITPELREEIALIKEKCRAMEEQIKLKKDLANQSTKEEDRSRSRCGSADSYTISNPVFPVSQLPEAICTNEKHESENDTTIDGPLSLQSEIVDEPSDKNNKDAQNETDKLSIPTPIPYEYFQSKFKDELKGLIDKQKQEYLSTLDVLKKKFSVEQQKLLSKIQSSMQQVTSTPLTSNSFAETEDEEFTEFQTCLQSISSGEKTIINDEDKRINAATIINAHVKGYLVRKLMQTRYVQEHIQHIRDTLQFVLSLNDTNTMGGSPLQDILLKTKLFKQLQGDLYRFNDIFTKYSTKERMKIIAADRELRKKREIQEHNEHLNTSFQGVF